MAKVLFDKISKATIPRHDGGKRISQNEEIALKSTFAESLLLSDQIYVNNFGPNLNLVVLLNWLGQDLLEELIHKGSISFFHSNTTVGYANKDTAALLNANPGFMAFQGVGSHFESVYDGTYSILKEQTELSDYDIGRLATLVDANNKDLDCFEIGKKASRKGNQLLETYDKSESKYLDFANAMYLAGLSSQLDCELVIAADRFLDNLNTYFDSIIDYSKLTTKPFQTILEYEDMPSLQALLLDGQISFEEIVKIRENKEAEKFRDWLFNIQNEDEIGVIKEYSKEVFHPLYETPFSKPVRFAINSALTIGLSFVEPQTAIITGLSYQAFDELIIDKISKGWSPKIFIKKIRKE
ncbi:hypothetical protein [Fodinibius sp. Rm-B-1B1-1]|uniref:hypothetical protein n=1 Tax=Fodinibius alkaliphilus TaxID=3140241 RepID=UPI00315A8186